MLAYDVASASQIELEIQAIKRLWLEAFPEDDEAAFTSYFQGRLAGAKSFVYMCQKEVASMAFSLPASMIGADNSSLNKVDFLVGVATAQKWRGHHFASQILQTIAHQAQIRSCHCLLLSTYIPQFYLKLGYQEVAWHKNWRWSGAKAEQQKNGPVFLGSKSDLAALAAYYKKEQQYGYLERNLNYWRWRFQDADQIYVLKDNRGNLSAYAIFNKDKQCEELLSDTSQGVAELIKNGNLANPFGIGSTKLNEKLGQDKDFEEVGRGSCQMVLPLTKRFKDEYSRSGAHFCCLDNW